MRELLSMFLMVVLPGPIPGFSQGKSASPSQDRPAFEMTVDNIMRGNGLVGYPPQAVRWSGDGQRVYFQWKQFSEPREKRSDTYVVNRDGTGLRKLTDEEAELAPPVNSERSKDKRLGVYVRDADVYLYDYATDKRRPLTHTSDAEMNPGITRDAGRVLFTRNNNLYAVSLSDGAIEQLTDIRTAGAAPAAAQTPGRGGFMGRQSRPPVQSAEERKGTDSQEYIKKEEKELLDVLKRQAEFHAEEEARRKKENPRKPFALSSRQSVLSLELAPDGKYVVALINERAQDAKNTIVPNYVTESAYTEDIPGRAKVGDSQSHLRIGLLSVETGEVKWVDHGQKLSPAVEGAAAGTSRESGRGGAGEREREVRLYPPVWSEDGARAVLLGRSGDNKDRWIFALDPSTGKTRVLFAEHDDAWLDGPGSSTLGWMKDDRSVYFQSERTGYSHLYAVPYAGGEPRALTSGNWEIESAQLSEDKSRFYLITTEASPFERHFYVMPAEGSERTKISGKPGFYQAIPSPDESTLAVIYSATTRPPELYLQENRPDAAMTQVTSSPAPDFWDYPWLDAPIIHFTARDGVEVPVRLFKPVNWKPGGAGIIFVHGSGYAQNVHRGWSSNSGPYLFHNLLVEHGYLVMDVDYRASAGYGRAWRTAIYRHMGGKDLDDEVDAAHWMVKKQGVDPKRVGIYGGSYGGFMTLMAMFTASDVFAAGAALRPVTDWAHYNHPYTSNILNLPQNDEEAYRRSSPIYHAEGLKGALLICHGIVDTNVHFQDTVRLVQRLIELRKENWELAVYPVENHGFVEPTSWADEFKRILKLFDMNLKPQPTVAPLRAKKTRALAK